MSAVELLQATKSLYVKSERVLENRQEWNGELLNGHAQSSEISRRTLTKMFPPPFSFRSFRVTTTTSNKADAIEILDPGTPISLPAKKAPPPVPPRTFKMSLPIPTTSLESQNEQNPITRKKTPPPVPAKPTHLRLSNNPRSASVSSPDCANNGDGRDPTKQTMASGDVEQPLLRARLFTSSMPHLHEFHDSFAIALIGIVDDNNNEMGDSDSDDKGRRSTKADRRLRKGRNADAARRKSLPSTIEVAAGGDDRTTQSRTPMISQGEGSYSAEHGSVLSMPTPTVEQLKSNAFFESLAERSDSERFFSTISTVSSDVSGQSNSDRFAKMVSTVSRRSNALLDQFLSEQTRRSISVIERHARIIKWLYACSNAQSTC